MSRFNQTSVQQNKTTNLSGGEAFKESPKLAFISLLLTSFVKDQYYRSANDAISEVTRLIDSISDKRFIAKGAIYARTKFGMRSISHVVAGELAERVKGEQWTKNFFNKIVYRPDDMTEILAYYYNKGNKNEPNAMKKGFARAFGRFDAYQLAKYKKEGQSVSLIDVANVVHPANTEAIAQLIKGTLPTPKTYETKLSAAGHAETEEQKEAQKAEAWKDLLTSGKIGYFALLRNLRNILEQAADMVDRAAELLVSEKLISNSLVLPFRFQTAIEEITKMQNADTINLRKILVAINQAVDTSMKNVPKFEGRTAVVLDVSGSMNGQPLAIGSLFSAVLLKSQLADFMVFSDDAAYVNYNPMDTTLTIADQIVNAREKNNFGGGTNFHSIFHNLNKAYDRIIILSDMQGWMGYDVPTANFNAYKKRLNTNPKIYSFDLAGYGTMQFPENNVFAIAGFSEKIFDVMKLLEQDRNALIAEIEKIEL